MSKRLDTTLHRKNNFSMLLLVQCSAKSIKTTLNNIFSCAMLSQASSLKDFTCAMLSQEYWNNIEQFLFLCNVVSSLLDNIAQGCYLWNLALRVLITEIFPVQCCLGPLCCSRQQCMGKNSCSMLSQYS